MTRLMVCQHGVTAGKDCWECDESDDISPRWRYVEVDDDSHDHEWGDVEVSHFTGTPHRKCQVVGCRHVTLDLSDDEDD